MNSLIRKLYGALKLYRTGIFNIILNRLFSGFLKYEVIALYYVDFKEPDLLTSITPCNKGSLVFERINNQQEEFFMKLCKTFPGQNFESRFRHKYNKCYVVLRNREIIAYAWIKFKEFYIEEINYTFLLESDEFFIYDCFVSRECRGEGIYPTLLSKILGDYCKDNMHRLAYIGVSFANIGSIRGIEKTAFREFNKIRYFKWFNKEKRWGTGHRPLVPAASDSAAGI